MEIGRKLLTGIGKGFVIGLVAGGTALVISYALRIFAGGIFVPEIASQTLTSLTPGTIESQAVANLGVFAKYSAFSGAIFGNLLLYGVIGILFHFIRLRQAQKGHIISILQLVAVSYVIIVVTAMMLSQITEITSHPLTLELITISLIPPQIVFGLISYYLFRIPVTKSKIDIRRNEVDSAHPASVSSAPEPDISKVSRREFLRMVGIIGAGSIASAVLFQWITQLLSSTPMSTNITAPPVNSTSAPTMGLSSEISSFYADEITPNDRFYRIDTNIIPPSIDSSMWSLMVTGLVASPLTMSYDDLKSMPSIEQYATLECVSDKVGDNLTSTALWKGVSLKDVLQRAQIGTGVIYIVFRCYDGYDVGIPLEQGLNGTILAYEMNGVSLPIEHGYPLRAIVPGLYGMHNPKWITSIELVDTVYQGFWQRRGWANEAHYKIHSSIVIPGNALSQRFPGLNQSTTRMLGNKVTIAGIAFAGDRGISKVEVSVDGGNSWEEAKIKKPLSSKNTWVLWATEWNPPSEGSYDLSVRAVDGNGNMQIPGFMNPFPDGSSGYHTISITIVKADT
jgi:DMSO/TMAO reductase YedYZ molybdopterin-dependent catalytic subunit